MTKYNLIINFIDETKPDLILLEITAKEAVAMIDLHIKELAWVQLDRVEEVSDGNNNDLYTN